MPCSRRALPRRPATERDQSGQPPGVVDRIVNPLGRWTKCSFYRLASRLIGTGNPRHALTASKLDTHTGTIAREPGCTRGAVYKAKSYMTDRA